MLNHIAALREDTFVARCSSVTSSHYFEFVVVVLQQRSDDDEVEVDPLPNSDICSEIA